MDMPDFCERIWVLCIKIPKGKVSTYKELAHALGTRAYRAVGQALKKNPHSPLIPCHRVVCSDGRLGGYHGRKNSAKKIALLRREGVMVRREKVMDFQNRLFSFKTAARKCSG